MNLQKISKNQKAGSQMGRLREHRCTLAKSGAHSRLGRCLVLVVLFLLYLPASAQPGDSCQLSGVAVGFTASMCSHHNYTVTFNDKVVTGFGHCTASEWVTSALTYTKLKEDEPKQLTVGADSCSTHIDFVVPEDYYLEIDGVEAKSIDKVGGTTKGSGDGSWTVILRKKCPCDKGGAGGSGGPKRGSVVWNVGMGNLTNGQTAHSISLRETVLSSYIYTPSALIYSPPGRSTEVDVVRSGNGSLRQVKAPQTLADVIVISASEYDIRFYSPANVGAKVGGLYVVSGQPYVTWKVKNPDPASLTRLQILKTQGAVTITNEYTWDAISNSWTLSTGNGARVETSTITYPTPTSRVETIVVKDNTGQVASKLSRTYHTFPWAENVIQEVLDPDGVALKTVYSYYENASEVGRYSRLKSIVNPDGSWEKHDYDSAGNEVLVLRPWKDLTLEAATEANSYATRYTYSNSDGINTSLYTHLLSSSTEKIGSVVVRKVTYMRSGTTVNGEPAVIEQQTAYSSVTESLLTTTTRYHASAQPSLANKVISREYPDGRKESYVHEKGNYVSNVDPAMSAFTPDINGLAERETVVHGTTTSPAGVSFKTTKETSVQDQYGHQVLSETYVYNGTGYERIAWAVTNYDDQSHVVMSRNLKGETITAVWTGEQRMSDIDAVGIETVYEYDSLNRVKKQTKKGIAAGGGFPAQADIVTDFEYDAEGRQKKETIGGGVVSQRVYDRSGRLTSETDQAGLNTTYSYANGGRTQTITRPGGATAISDKYTDGQPKSMTGTAVVPRYFDYGVNVDGTRYTQEFTGSAGLSSPRWTKTSNDWVDRTVAVEKPSFSGANLVQTSIYNSLGQLQKQTITANTTKLIADKLYEYDQLGQQIRSGSDIDASGTLTLISTDRLIQTDTLYEKVGNDWFGVTSTITYLTDNNNTPSVQMQRARLNNFLLNGTEQTVSEVTLTDVAGNSTTTSVTIDRAAKKETSITDTPDSNVNAVGISVNGLLQSSTPTTPQSATTYAYDALGRQISVTDPRTGTITRSYSQTNGQLTATNDGAGTTLFEYYPATHVNAGQLKTQTNPASKKIYFNYSNRRELIQTWGDATYPIEYVYDAYGQKTEMHTFRGGQSWTASTWPAATTGTADVTKWIYQSSTGLLTQKQDATLKGASYTYDELGRLKTRLWARAITCTYGYDPNTGEMRTVTYSDSTPALAFAHDRGGRQISVTDASGSHTRSFNVAGELQSDQITGGILDGVSVNVGYDGFLRRQSLQTLLGANTLSSQTYGYDNTSRMETVTSSSQTATYAYYPNSGLLNTTSFSGGANSARTYDSQGRLQNITTSPASDTPQSYTYAYNNLNQRWRVTREDGSYWSYIYNDRGELVSGKKYWSDNSIVWGGQTEYNFDNIGNRKDAKNGGNQLGTLRQSNYATNSLNQYSQRSVPGAVDVTGTANTAATVTVNSQVTARRANYFYKELAVDNSAAPANAQVNVVGARNNFGAGGEDAVTEKGGRVFVPQAVETFTHDDDGNLTSDGRWNYIWDAENRLASMEAIASVPAEAKQRLEFAYDHMARRIQKKVYVWNLPTSSYQLQSVTKFVNDGWNLMAELNSSNALIRSYVWGQDMSGTLHGAGGIGGLLTIEGEGNTYCVAQDGNGNVTTLVKSGVGTISASYDYDAFGNTLQASGDYASKNPFRFSTKLADQETGLIYYGYRYHNPSYGRWLTRDPVEESGGANLYALLANDSISRSDYLGLLDPLEFWRNWSASQRKKWFDDFRNSYNAPINDAANKHCVPKRLLAAIIANEMIDYSSSEGAGEWAGFGRSLGPAQITINTAIRYGLTDLDRSQFGPSWIPWRSAEKNYKSAVRKYLQDPAKNIDAAARLMAKYLDELCNKALNGGLNKGFIRDIVAGPYLENFCCRKKKCDEIVNMNPSDALIRSMAALWNNDIGVTQVGDVARESPNAFNHAWWASRLFNAPVVD
jgi:RHS repeat-associated protein